MRLFVYDPDNPNRESVLAYACQQVRNGQTKVHLVVCEPKKSREQEEHYHALIGDIAKQDTVYGKKLPAESWKRLLIDAFKHDTHADPDLAPLWRTFGDVELVPALNHPGFVMVGDQSRKFGVKLASAFIDWLYAYGAEHHIRWSHDEHQAHAYERDAIADSGPSTDTHHRGK